MKTQDVIDMYTKENVLKWFENYKTFCYNEQDIAQIKHEFLVGELNELHLCCRSEKAIKQIYNKVKEWILKC